MLSYEFIWIVNLVVKLVKKTESIGLLDAFYINYHIIFHNTSRHHLI